MNSEFRMQVLLLGALSSLVLLFACGEDEPSDKPTAPVAPTTTEVTPATVDEVTPLVAVMRELDRAWLDALDASGSLEDPALEDAARATQLERWRTAYQRIDTLIRDPRLAAAQPELSIVFDAMRDGLRAGFSAWSLAAENGDAAAMRQARVSVDTSCASCHRSMRDEAPAKLAASMRRIEVLHQRIRTAALEVEAKQDGWGSYARMAAAAAEIAAIADSGALRPIANAPAEHAQQRAEFQAAAEALKSAAEGRSAPELLRAFGPLGYSCLRCHEARNVQIKQ